MQNYFNYYTEIEEHFQRRRGTLLMLSTLDWSLIATWQEAGFPVEAVIAGIDATFDKHAARQSKGRVRRINGLAYCGQEVLRAVEDMRAAATGAIRRPRPTAEDNGFETDRIIAHLSLIAVQIGAAEIPPIASQVISETKERLIALADALVADRRKSNESQSMESLEKHLLVLEDRLFAALQTFTPAGDLLALQEHSAKELAPYRSRLQTVQIRQIEQQFLRRCLFEKYKVPRLSLFYMRQT